MNKKLKFILLCAVLFSLLIGNMSIYAAGEDFAEMPPTTIKIVPGINNSKVALSSPSLTACEVGIGIADNGLLMSFDTTATQIADEIGVKNVILQEKTWYGGWKDIPASNYCTYNSDFYAGDVVYTAATKGTTYRIKCTHYAKFGSTELTLNNTSSELTYN